MTNKSQTTKFRLNYVMGSIMLLGTIGAIGAGIGFDKQNQASKVTCRAAIQADIRGTLERSRREQAALAYYSQKEAAVTTAMSLPITIETNAGFDKMVAEARAAGGAFRRITEEPRPHLAADAACPPMWLNN